MTRKRRPDDDYVLFEYWGGRLESARIYHSRNIAEKYKNEKENWLQKIKADPSRARLVLIPALELFNWNAVAITELEALYRP